MTIATSKNVTILGIATIVAALAGVITSLFDGDPVTNPDWGFVVAQIVAGVGLILAKGSASTGGTVTGAGVPVVDPAPPVPQK